MKIQATKTNRFYPAFIFFWTLGIFFFLATVTYHINAWPTDSENPYIPSAARLFNLPFFSYMHYLPETQMLQITMRFKETLILGIAIMQRILNDDHSLYPNVLLLILSISASSLLVYAVMKKFFNRHIGFLAFLLFSSCFWPYMYALQGSHPPLVLMNFLLAAFILQRANGSKWLHVLSGIALGLMMFSSPTSPIYLPYYAAVFFFCEKTIGRNSVCLKKTLLRLFLITLGALLVFFFFTIPDPLFCLKQTFGFLQFSRKGNNFVIYQRYLSQFFPVPDSLRGGGWAWIAKYFLLILPVLFPVYSASLIYLLKKYYKNFAVIALIIMSLSTPLLVEAIKVAQFGRNYFSWIIGIIFLICFAANDIVNACATRPPTFKKLLSAFGLAIILIHISFNFRVFLSDILPSRLVTTNIYNWTAARNINELSTYPNHPRDKNLILFFNNPKLENKVYFWPIQSIRDVQKGFIYIPTLTGKTIWCECREKDFSRDPDLTELYESGEFEKFVVAKFPTLSSSKIWTQEEEICTYRDLIVGDIKPQDRQKGFAWILDAEKLQKEWFTKKSKDK